MNITVPNAEPNIHVGTSGVHIRGYDSYILQATWPRRIGARFIDLCWISGLFFAISVSFNLSPIPSWNTLLFISLSGALYFSPQFLLFGKTIGHRIWHLRPKAPSWRGALTLGAFEQALTSPFQGLIAIFLTLFHFSGTAFLAYQELHHPYWLAGSEWKLDTFLPSSEDWLVTPFFYALGGWPVKFDQQTVYYSLAYESAPPTRFVGHVIAHWENPGIKVILEGPKTPRHEVSSGNTLAGGNTPAGAPLSVSQIRDCFTKAEVTYTCAQTREFVLDRHLQEMRKLFPHTWIVNWFEVDHSQFAPGELTQGIYVSGRGKNRIQDRFILINSRGIHQAVILNRPNSPRGEAAFDLLQKTIRSLRNFGELDAGRAWVDRDLSTIRLENLAAFKPSSRQSGKKGQSKLENNSLASSPLAKSPPSKSSDEELIRIQSLLISKISVDPANFDSYYHLAGTSFMLTKNQVHQQNGIGVAALQNLYSAFQFAKDLSPEDSRTRRLQNLWLEAKKH